MLRALAIREGERPLQLQSAKEIAAKLADSYALWVDLDNPAPEETSVLTDLFKFHPLAIEQCLEQATHPKISDFRDYVYMVVHGITPAEEGLDTKELDLFLGKNYLVTYHEKPMRSVSEAWRRCVEVEHTLSRGPDFVLLLILDTMHDHYVESLQKIDEEIERIESELFRRQSPRVLQRIFELKKSLIELRRVINPQREVMNKFARGEFGVVKQDLLVRYRDIYDQLYRISEFLEALREILSSSLEIYLTQASNRLNQIVKVLTVLSTILLPLGVITGFFGMNVKLPITGTAWDWLIILGFLAMITGGMLGIFRWKKWI